MKSSTTLSVWIIGESSEKKKWKIERGFLGDWWNWSYPEKLTSVISFKHKKNKTALVQSHYTRTA
jgi:hypothetical protein